jgi:hypothetical protein
MLGIYAEGITREGYVITEDGIEEEYSIMSAEDADETWTNEADSEYLEEGYDELSELIWKTYRDVTGLTQISSIVHEDADLPDIFLFSDEEDPLPPSEKLSDVAVRQLKEEITERIANLRSEKIERQNRMRLKEYFAQRDKDIKNILPHLPWMLGDYDVQREAFFNACSYNLTFEDNKTLSPWEIWKIVVTFNGETHTFDVVVGKERDTAHKIPESIEEAMKVTLSNEMPRWAWVHRNIPVDKNSSRFWGGNFITISKTHLLIGWMSGDFGAFPEDIVRTAFKNQWIQVSFLSNRENISSSRLYYFIHKNGLAK